MFSALFGKCFSLLFLLFGLIIIFHPGNSWNYSELNIHNLVWENYDLTHSYVNREGRKDHVEILADKHGKQAEDICHGSGGAKRATGDRGGILAAETECGEERTR